MSTRNTQRTSRAHRSRPWRSYATGKFDKGPQADWTGRGQPGGAAASGPAGVYDSLRPQPSPAPGFEQARERVGRAGPGTRPVPGPAAGLPAVRVCLRRPRRRPGPARPSAIRRPSPDPIRAAPHGVSSGVAVFESRWAFFFTARTRAFKFDRSVRSGQSEKGVSTAPSGEKLLRTASCPSDTCVPPNTRPAAGWDWGFCQGAGRQKAREGMGRNAVGARRFLSGVPLIGHPSFLRGSLHHGAVRHRRAQLEGTGVSLAALSPSRRFRL